MIKAMLKLLAAGSRGGFQWQFSDTAPYDVVIVDANSVDVGTPRVKAMAPASLVLFESGAAAAQPSSLVRPLRADRLQAQLLAQQTMLNYIHKPVAQQPIQPRVPTAAKLFKLRRWPHQQLLRRDPQRIKMATLLSRRPMAVDELALISGLPQDQCHAFMQLLQSMNLLDIQTASPTAPPPGAGLPHAGVAQTPKAEDSASRWSFVRSIRKRLGI